MEVLSPLTRAREVDPLVDAGATELYAGVLDRDWQGSFTDIVSNNDRPAAGNVPSLEELGDAVAAAHARKVPVYLTLNIDYFTARQGERVGRLMERAAGLGVDGFIIADIPTMLRARREHPDVMLHVSSKSVCINRGALRFFAELGAERVVLPRQLTPAEITTLATDTPLDLEVFVFNFRCMNLDGFCTFLESVQRSVQPVDGGLGYDLLHSRWALKVGRRLPTQFLRMVRRIPAFQPAPCMLEYATEPITVGSVPLEDMAAARERMSSHFRAKVGIDCGACVLRTLIRAGIKGAKIIGRDNDLARKVQDVRHISALLRAAEDDTVTDEELLERTRRAFREGYSGSCRDEVCYYRTFLPRA